MPDRRLRIHSDPGTRYGYPGDGFYVLQLILEEELGLDVGLEMQRRGFDRLGMPRPDFDERSSAERIYPALARAILGDISLPWSWGVRLGGPSSWSEVKKEGGPIGPPSL